MDAIRPALKCPGKGAVLWQRNAPWPRGFSPGHSEKKTNGCHSPGTKVPGQRSPAVAKQSLLAPRLQPGAMAKH
ncbi:MAG: hypothetical protein D6730_14645 [Bacteroidetes bacterium]|nr:MAG: hypothetical protein D6730_14645 [Bacteroidota bacterium]